MSTSFLAPDVSYAQPSRPPAPWLLERRSTAWRAPLAAASLVTAATHVAVTGEHLQEAFYIGVLFIALEVAAVLLAAALLRRPARGVLLAIALVGALAVLALVVSRTVGLPLIGDDVGDWTDPLAAVSLAAEVLMVIGGVAAGLGRAAATRRTLLAGGIAGVLILGLGALFTVAAIAAGSGGAGHEMGDGHHMEHMDMGLGAAPLSPADTDS